MCGIFGVTNDKNAPQTILSGLKRLEYRGYDSWGTDQNSHPHLDCTKKLAIVHNGIIDNWQELKSKIKNHKFISQTDSEIAVHLLEDELKKQPDLFKAFTKVFPKIHGCNALISVHQGFPYLVAGKTGSPLVIGVLKGNNLIASDVSSLLPLTQDVVFMEDGQIAKIESDKIEIFDALTRKEIPLKISHINWTSENADKGDFPHFMLKEIYEEPQVISNLLKTKIYEVEHLSEQIKKSKNIFTVACGTAAYAALAGQYFFSRIAKYQLNPAIGSEFYYHTDFLDKDSLCIALSQSGETIDTLQSIQHAKNKQSKIISLINVPGSSLERLSDQTILIEAGPEKAVASTKAFIAKVTLLFMTAYSLVGQPEKGITDIKKATLAIKKLLKAESIKDIKSLAKEISKEKNIFVLGRGQSYPAALEIALKIKEVSYIHAEGLPAGELKHGPIALIETGTPCIILNPDDETSSDVLSSAMEVKARGAYVVGIGVKNNPVFDYWIPIKESGQATVIPIIIAGQLLAYYLALANNADPDMPRNLAKSVTVK